MILQALETLPSSSASCSRESFLLVLWESVVIWVLRIVGCLAITNLPRRPGWLRTDLTPCVVEAGSSQLSENYETSSAKDLPRHAAKVPEHPTMAVHQHVSTHRLDVLHVQPAAVAQHADERARSAALLSISARPSSR